MMVIIGDPSEQAGSVKKIKDLFKTGFIFFQHQIKFMLDK